MHFLNALAYHNQEKMKQNGLEKITKLVKKEEKDVRLGPSGTRDTTETTLVKISLLPRRSSNNFMSLSHCVYRGSGAAEECSYFTEGFAE